MDVRLVLDDSRLVKALRAAPASAAAEVRDALFHIKAKFFKGWWREATKRLDVTPRVGLINRVTGAVTANPGRLENAAFRLRNISRAFWLHERGGTVSSRGRLLPVPLTRWRVNKAGNLTEVGTKRRTLSKLLADKKLRVYPTRKGAFLGRRVRFPASPVFLFKLERQVKVPASLKFFATWASLKPWMVTRLDLALQRATRRAEAAAGGR
jgi:hypothetical protein